MISSPTPLRFSPYGLFHSLHHSSPRHITRSPFNRSLRSLNGKGKERVIWDEWLNGKEGRHEERRAETGTNQGSVCKVGTQDPENLDEELKPLVTVWSVSLFPFHSTLISQPKAWRSERRDRRHGGGCDGNGNRTDGPTIRLWILELGTRDHIVVTVRLSFALSGSLTVSLHHLPAEPVFPTEPREGRGKRGPPGWSEKSERAESEPRQ